jgi:hypothetical protein
MELLAFLRIAEYEKVEIRYKSGKIDLIEGMERIKVPAKIHEILRQQDYASIEVMQQDGQIVSLTRKTKKKIHHKRDAP